MRKTIWDEMNRMKKRMNRVWRGFDENPWEFEDSDEDLTGYRKAWVDARDSGDEFVVSVELPGVEKKDIQISVDEGYLAIRVEKKSESEKKTEEQYSYSKDFIGFYRRIPLPENADVEKIDASYRDGILKLRIPKLRKEKKKGREIEVR